MFKTTGAPRSNLTLNVGLRWEHETPTTGKYNRAVDGFNPAVMNPVGGGGRNGLRQESGRTLASQSVLGIGRIDVCERGQSEHL